METHPCYYRISTAARHHTKGPTTMTTNPTTEHDVTISISSPAPMSMVGSLLGIISAAYPQTSLAPAEPGKAMTLRIPDTAEPVDTDDPASHVLEIERFDPTQITVRTPQEVALLLGEIMEAAFAETPEAKNYLESSLTLRTHKYVMTFQRRDGSTPHDLRLAAEARAEAAEAALAGRAPQEGTVTPAPVSASGLLPLPEGCPTLPKPGPVTLRDTAVRFWERHAGLGAVIVSDGCGRFTCAADGPVEPVDMTELATPRGWELAEEDSPRCYDQRLPQHPEAPEGGYLKAPGEAAVSMLVTRPGAYVPAPAVVGGRVVGWVLLFQEREPGSLPLMSVQVPAETADRLQAIADDEPVGPLLVGALRDVGEQVVSDLQILPWGTYEEWAQEVYTAQTGYGPVEVVLG